MNRRITLGLLLALSLVAGGSLSASPARQCHEARKHSTEVSGSIHGSFDYGVEAWVGHLEVSFGDQPPKVASFVDRNTSFNLNDDGSFYGTETISLTFLDGSGTFDILARFFATPASTPALFYLDETGTIANGTGEYAGVTGHVKVRGPFMLPDPTIVQGPPPWIAEMHGHIRGLDEG